NCRRPMEILPESDHVVSFGLSCSLAVVVEAVLAAPVDVDGQPKIPRIAVLDTTSMPGRRHLWDIFRGELRALGYVEGANISIESRWADDTTERLPGLVAELVRLGPDLIVRRRRDVGQMDLQGDHPAREARVHQRVLGQGRRSRPPSAGPRVASAAVHG